MLQLHIILFTLTFSCNGRMDSSFRELLKIISGKWQPTNVSPERFGSLEPSRNRGPPNYRRIAIRRPQYGTVYDLKSTYFCPVPRSSQVNAVKASEDEMPWVARVVLSPDQDIPYLCTASAVRSHVFLTAARCLFTLKVGFVSVLYGKHRYFPRAFVLPSKPTRQMFDDAGFIVVDDAGGHWENVPMTNQNQTIPGYTWIYNWNVDGTENTIVGYVDEPAGINLYYLKNVMVNNYLCNAILSELAPRAVAYYVPCAYPCNVVFLYAVSVLG